MKKTLVACLLMALCLIGLVCADFAKAAQRYHSFDVIEAGEVITSDILHCDSETTDLLGIWSGGPADIDIEISYGGVYWEFFDAAGYSQGEGLHVSESLPLGVRFVRLRLFALAPLYRCTFAAVSDRGPAPVETPGNWKPQHYLMEVSNP